MKLSKIHIENYRAIDDIHLNFNSCINVIYGKNGVGKTSILSILNDLFLSINTNKKNIFTLNSFRNPSKRGYIELKFSEKKIIKAECNLPTKIIDNEDVYLDNTQITTDIPSIKYSSFLAGLIAPKVEILNQDAISFGFRIEKIEVFAYNRGINYLAFKQQFEDLENLENQKKIQQNTSYQDPTLKTIRNTLKLINPDFESLTINREDTAKPLCIKRKNKLLDIKSQLSSGEANIIALISRIAIDNYLQNSDERIVLIDEIDISLHPKWQTLCCKLLKQAFPKMQFILTSHSPFVWAGLDANEIINLDFTEDGKVVQKPVDYAKGGSIENIIAKFFDSPNYDEDFLEELHNIESKIAKKDSKVQIDINNLKIKYGPLPIINNLLLKARMFGL